MKLHNILFTAFAALAIPAGLVAQPVVSNVAFVQQPDGAGSTELVVTYDLVSSNGDAAVTLFYSTNGGGSFAAATTTTGAVGAGVAPGAGKTIDWAVGTDLSGQQLSGNFIVRVLAEDGVAGLAITSSEAGAVHQTAAQTLTFTFTEPVVGFDATDVTVAGGSVGAFTPVSGTSYTLMVTGTGGAISATVGNAAATSLDDGRGVVGASFSNFYQDTWTITLPGSVPMDLIRIPAGTFTMGAPIGELSRDWDEAQHTVSLSQDFYLGKTEVTQQQWLAILPSWPGPAPSATNGVGNSFPAYDVTHNDIQPYLSALNTAITEPGTFSLPTESQWEYAARAGTTTRFNFGDAFGADDDCSAEAERTNNMWYCGNNTGSPPTPTYGAKAVGQLPANGWGLRDMHGNVWEWCSDWYDTYPGTVTDPTGPVSGSYRVIRGGGWVNFARVSRSAFRNGETPATRYPSVGFRVLAVRPVSLAITSSETAAVHQTATQTLTFTFEQPVTGFDASDVTLAGATAGTFTPVSATVYSLAVTGTGGTVSATISADAAVESTAAYVGTAAASFSNFYQDTWTLSLPGSVPMDLIRIPAGTFAMGSPSGELSRDDTAGVEDQHTVTLTQDFYIGKTEVTQQQWLAIRGSWPGTAPSSTYGVGNDFPAYFVSHNDIQTFMTDLDTAITEPGTFNLPTESQWEYAARAGSTTRFSFGDGMSTDETCALGAGRETNMWYCGNNTGSPPTPTFGNKAVGLKPANAWGLQDMHGNVVEWCADFYGTYPGTVTDPTGPGSGTHHVIRGGGSNDSARFCRSAKRRNFVPTTRGLGIGFRVAAVR